jgi:hypothetical protein
MELNLAAFFIMNKVIRLISYCLPFLLRFEKRKIRFIPKIEKPYFQYINLSRIVTHSIFTLLPYSSSAKIILKSKVDMAIFKAVNLLIIYSSIVV